MPSFPDACKEVVLGILFELKRAGIPGTTRTALVKYVYLLDTFTAEERGSGEIWTKLEWRFHHFGPHAEALVDCLDWMESHSLIEREDRSRADGRDFMIYRLIDRADLKPLDRLGVPANVVSRLSQVMREFAYSLPDLLDFVYFRTAPMEDARPQEILRFDGCRKANYKEDVRPLRLRVPDKNKAERMRELIANMHSQDVTARPRFEKAVYDDHYLQALRGDDLDGAGEESGSLIASIEFQAREDERR